MLSSLCRPDGREILSLSLHPLQSHVPEGELLKAAERSVMTVVAQVKALSLNNNTSIPVCCGDTTLEGSAGLEELSFLS